jgi:5-methyltetrahydropteroyltriglutamate--homocysteine methyltransferase
MSVQTTVIGSYPKPPPEGGTFVLRKTLHALERDDATPDDLRAAHEELTREVIAEQEGAGIDVVTDGAVRWDDIVTPFARHMAGFEVGGLLRFFDNNVYYRRPVCTGPVEWRGPATVEEFKFAQSVATVPVKAVIPGPVTFAHLSIDEFYNDHVKFVMALASVLAQEAFELQAAGATVIQIDEPALLGAPEDIDLARRAIKLVVGELTTAETILTTYFGDAKRLGGEIFSLPVHIYGLDFVSGPENREVLKLAPQGTRLQAGVVDARNTMLEPVDDLAATIGSLAETVGLENLWVAPSAGLEFLPREKAQSKLQRLAQAAKKVGA